MSDLTPTPDAAEAPATARQLNAAVETLKPSLPGGINGFMLTLVACFLATQCSVDGIERKVKSAVSQNVRTHRQLNSLEAEVKALRAELAAAREDRANKRPSTPAVAGSE